MKKSVSNESFYRVALARERWLRKHPSVGGFSTWHFHVAWIQAYNRFTDHYTVYDKIDGWHTNKDLTVVEELINLLKTVEKRIEMASNFI